MEGWSEAAVWTALGLNLAAGAWNLVTAIRHERKATRLDRETYEKRPLVPADMAEVMRPGDTLLLILHDGWQQDAAYKRVAKMQADALVERGIKTLCLNESDLKSAILMPSSYGNGDSDGGDEKRP